MKCINQNLKMVKTPELRTRFFGIKRARTKAFNELIKSFQKKVEENLTFVPEHSGRFGVAGSYYCYTNSAGEILETKEIIDTKEWPVQISFFEETPSHKLLAKIEYDGGTKIRAEENISNSEDLKNALESLERRFIT